MTRARSWPWLVALALSACVTRIPPHLQVDPPADEQPRQTTPPPATIAEAERLMVGKDPLARAPKLLPEAQLEALDGGAGLLEFTRQVRELERGDGQVERVMQQLEDEHRGSAVVPLARGYRLRIIENLLATTPTLEEPAERRIAVLLTPLQDASVDDTLPRPPLAWLGTAGADPAETLRRVGDRWVLVSWLHDPALDLAPIGEALSSPIYDGMIQQPIGALVLARATGASGPVEEGLADLRRATDLALQRAAADRNGEQAAWSAAKKAAADELGVDDPVVALLRRAAEQLTPAAGDDRAAGAALLALAALRWENACADAPCSGLDRVQWMGWAGRWDDEVAPLAATWQVIATKESVDGMDVGHETVRFPMATIDLADALLGTGAGPLELSLLRRRRPEAQVWLELARATGTEGATEWNEAHIALGGHLERLARSAAEITEDAATRDLLERIASRAVP